MLRAFRLINTCTPSNLGWRVIMEFIHKNLAQGGWFEMSLSAQLGNVGSEVGRAANWQKKGNMESRDKALDRAFELLDLTISGIKNGNELKELCRTREVLADVFYGDNVYHDSPEGMEKYFYHYALEARKGL